MNAVSFDLPICRTIGQLVFCLYQSSCVIGGGGKQSSWRLVDIKLCTLNCAVFCGNVWWSACCAKIWRRDSRVIVWRHTLNDVTVSNETPRTPFAQLQLMVPSFPIYGREHVCSIPQCFAKSTHEMSLNRPEDCLPGHLLWPNRLRNELLHKWACFALHSKNNHCTKQLRC
jgi:hypothetical protein